jgi:hypothetical protein
LASLRISVGASLEASALTVFQRLEKAAENARKVIESTGKSAGKALGSGLGGGAAQASTQLAVVGKRGTESLGRISGKGAELERRFKALAQSAKQGLDLKALADQATRELRRIETQAARTALGLNKSPGALSKLMSGKTGIGGALHYGLGSIGIAGPIGMGMGALGSAASFARRLGSEMGYKTDFGEMMGRGVEQESRAQKIVNAGYMPGVSGADQLQTKTDILAEARKVSVDTATDMNDALGALEKYVGLTGDLATGRSLLADMAKLSRATGTNVEDMASAAAEVANHLGDVPDKGDVTLAIMRQIAGQGKLGAIEIKDMASQMARVAATARKFAGGAASNIALFGAIAQEAKLTGGTTSAAQASRSVASLAASFTTPGTIKAWASHGMTPYTDASRSELSNPQDLIMRALKATTGKSGKADLAQLRNLFPNQLALKAVSGFADIYNEGGGGVKGMAAVSAEFERLKTAALSAEEVDRAFAASMQTSEAKAMAFSMRLESVGQQLGKSLIGPLEDLAPLVIDAASAFMDWVSVVDSLLPGSEERTARKQQEEAARLERKIKAESAGAAGLQATATTTNVRPFGLIGPPSKDEQEQATVYSPKAFALAKQEEGDLSHLQRIQQQIAEEKRAEATKKAAAASEAAATAAEKNSPTSRRLYGGEETARAATAAAATAAKDSVSAEATAVAAEKTAAATKAQTVELNATLKQIIAAIKAGKGFMGPAPVPGTTPPVPVESTEENSSHE